MNNVRPATLSDLPYVYEICHRTGFSGADASSLLSDGYILGHYFAAPYLHHNLEWCWVVQDERGPVGYLVTTPDSQDFVRWMNDAWLPHVRALYAGVHADPNWTGFEKWIRGYIQVDAASPDFATSYPAHLHICLLPRAQGAGYGGRLIRAFEEKLRARRVPGYHLGMAEKNVLAGRFYEKQGMRLLRHDPGVIYYGKTLE